MLAILTTHPIQYQVPLWQALGAEGRIPFEVWYLTDHAIRQSADIGFGKSFAWDLDMLAGYPHRFLNVAPDATPNSFWGCRLRESLSKRMRDANVNAIWIQGWQVAAYWQAVWAAKKIGAEVFLRGESNDLAVVPFWKRAIKRVVLGQLFRRVDRFLFIGAANRRLYEKFGVGDDRLYTAPYAVDNHRFARQASEIRNSKLEIRKEWKIRDDAFVILFCGKFIPKKRPLDLVFAADLLEREGRVPSIHLLFVGSGELGAALRANCNVVFDQDSARTSDLRNLASETRPPASFAGFLNQTEISRAYVAADCLVLPSDHGETWGLVVNEAMASGLPCIISDACGCAENMGRIFPNHVYPMGSIEALASGIVEMSAAPCRVPSDEWRGLYSLAATVQTVQRICGISNRT